MVEYGVVIPVLWHLAELCEVFKNLVSARGILYFAVALERESLFCQVLCCGIRTVLCASNDFKTFSHLENSVLMAHPYLLAWFYSFKEGTFYLWIEIEGCETEFTCFSLTNLSVVSKLNDIVTVAQSKNWNIKVKNL